MTPPSLLPKSPRARRRRAKRGVVAAYIHDISPRHRTSAATDTARIVTARPVTAPAAVTTPPVAAG